MALIFHFFYMNLFRSYTFSWWQMGIIKLTLLAIGVSIGVQWESFFEMYHVFIWSIAIVGSLYGIYISLRQL
jgi:hypothetical protein